MDSAIFEALIQALRDIKITQYTQLASCAIVLFEHVITLGDEVELIWRKGVWTLGKVLFVLNRYYSLGAFILNSYAILSPTIDDSTYLCLGLAYFRWQGWTGLIGCLFAEAVLQMRLYALYSLNKKILALMLTCWLICSTISAYVMYSVMADIKVSAVPIPRGRTCAGQNVSDRFYAFWIPMLAFEFMLCLLALIRGFQTYRSDGSLFHSGQRLVGILVRDSLLYFLVIFATYLTCLLIWIIAPLNFLGVPVGFSLAMSCVLANRIALNVRAISRDLDASKIPTACNHSMVFIANDNSFCSAGTLRSFEMENAAPNAG